MRLESREMVERALFSWAYNYDEDPAVRMGLTARYMLFRYRWR